MIKSLTKFFIYFIILTILATIYLSYFGIKTTKFNNLIKNEISKIDKKINIQLRDVKIILNLSDFSIGLKTENPKLIFNKKKINLENIKTNFFIGSFLKKEFAIKNVLIKTKKKQY